MHLPNWSIKKTFAIIIGMKVKKVEDKYVQVSILTVSNVPNFTKLLPM